jgi:hypothetical protein
MLLLYNMDKDRGLGFSNWYHNILTSRGRRALIAGTAAGAISVGSGGVWLARTAAANSDQRAVGCTIELQRGQHAVDVGRLIAQHTGQLEANVDTAINQTIGNGQALGDTNFMNLPDTPRADCAAAQQAGFDVVEVFIKKHS